jgi:hypothetical protein
MKVILMLIALALRSAELVRAFLKPGDSLLDLLTGFFRCDRAKDKRVLRLEIGGNNILRQALICQLVEADILLDPFSPSALDRQIFRRKNPFYGTWIPIGLGNGCSILRLDDIARKKQSCPGDPGTRRGL